MVALFNAVAKEQKALQGQLEEVETAGEAKKAQGKTHTAREKRDIQGQREIQRGRTIPGRTKKRRRQRDEQKEKHEHH